MKRRLIALTLFFIVTSLHAQTTLQPGDVAITGYTQHGHNIDESNIDLSYYSDDRANGAFSFVLLKDITSGTVIHFTDHGVNGNNTTLMTGDNNDEGNITWTANTNISAGTNIIIILNHDGVGSASSGTVNHIDGEMKLEEEEGDQILVYQGSPTSPSYIFAINWDNREWNGRNNRKEETELPAGLIDGQTALGIANNISNAQQRAHAQYDCSVLSAGASSILAAITNNNNWNSIYHDGSANESGESWVELTGCSFEFLSATTWDGSYWDNGEPNISIDAIIAADYIVDSVNPSFSCKTLTVNTGATCRVEDDKYIEIENNISVAGTLVVTTRGSIVQNSPNGTITMTGDGKIQNEKITALANNYYEYTYWSSPMSNTTFNNTFSNISTQSRYTFNASNFADGNGDSYDDNYNAWVPVGGDTVWAAGVGYTGYPDPDAFNADDDGAIKYTFEGIFNNGTITVPVYRNDEYTTDDNSNLLGNPYPSAIDVNAFFEANEYNGVQTPSSSYATSEGNTQYDTGITSVAFNEINNSDINKNSAYEDFTNISTTLIPGQTYDLTVKINTDGDWTSHTWVWIDWNLDGDFSDNGEAYDLGQDTNLNNVATASSPFSITVPGDAVAGKRTMRVSSKYYSDPLFDETGFDGEVEDYSIIIGGGKALDAIVYLWSQNTAPNAGQFSSSDYAYINKTGGVAGGDGIVPASYIPSGQGFFVNFSDSATPVSGQSTVTFTNSMRVLTNNQQFFRTSNNKKSNKEEADKLRLNLTSDNGVFNQILVAYLDNATDKDDGLSYDAPRKFATGASAYLYSLQSDDLTKKYAIQAKNKGSINPDEVIKIGYTTNVNQATLYTLSIDDLGELDGSFFESVPVIVKDNVTGDMHDLKTGPYNFISENGTYNDRFEIVFQAQSLGTDDNVVSENALKIIEDKNGQVNFNYTGNSNMISIEIFDIQGRAVYNFRVNNNNANYNLSNLRQAPFIARVTLDNNVVLNKKAIKRY